MTRERPPLLTVSEAAVAQLVALLAQRGKPSAGVRIGVRTRGCSGLSYTLEYADAQDPADDVVQVGDIKLFIDPKAVMFLLGTQMDYTKTDLEEGFAFTNPNEKGRCGCGESFHV